MGIWMVHFFKVAKCFESLKALYRFPIIIIIVSEVKWVRQLTSKTAVSRGEMGDS